MTIEELLSKARNDLERATIELAYEMGRVKGKQEALDIINEVIGDDEDE